MRRESISYVVNDEAARTCMLRHQKVDPVEAIPNQNRNRAKMSVPPALRTRVIFALLLGVVAALYAYDTHRSFLEVGQSPDSLFLWRGARILLGGGDPYNFTTWRTMPVGETDIGAWRNVIEPLYYPLPALLIWIPFSFGSFLVGSAAFVGIGAALFVFAISRAGLHRIWLCGSVGFIMALRFGQWSTWLTAAALLPMLSFLLPAKPNLGLPLVLAKPTRAMVFGSLAILVLSLIVMPRWPLGWYATVTGPFTQTVPHPAPVTTFGGVGALVLVAILRWRRPEARLLMLMACVPQLPFWADQLPLATIAETRREVIWSMLGGHLFFIGWFLFAPKVIYYVPVMQPYALFGTYVPALIMVLRRPNEGDSPEWFDALLIRLPASIRGSRATATQLT